MISNYSKSRLLIGASTAFIATLSGTMAVAQVTGASVLTNAASPITSTVVGSIVSGDGAAQLNEGAIEAGVTGSTITTTVTGASTGTFTNSSNTADALAQGNRNGVTVSLATISSTSAVSDGIAIATVSNNTGAITATATNQDAGATLTGFTAGSVAVASNSIDATTVINDGTGIYAVAINNAVPVGYSDLATAAATAVIGNAVGTDSTIDAAGTLVAANTQVTLGANSNATAGSSTSGDENTILLSLLSTAANSVTGSAVLDSNNVGASFAGNARTTSIGIASDNASFAGTAVIANSQSFDGNTTTGDNALNQGSRIAATVANAVAATTTAGSANVFSASSLSVNTNQITSAASGNVATGSISLANALSYDGGDGATNTSLASVEGFLTDTSAVSAQAISVTGDLILASRQTNTDSAAAFLKATTDDAVISASVQETVGSATTLSTNRVTAAATGNRLDNSVASGTGSALFDASVTLANLQINGSGAAFAIGATVSDTALTVTLGDTDNGTVVGSSAAMAGNIVASSAIGSQSDQTVALAAATITTGAGYATVLFDQSAAVTTEAGVETSGAVTIASRQINESAAVSADSLRTAITLTSNDDVVGTATVGVTANNALSVTGNIQQAFAMGGDAGNSLSLAGVSVGAAAGIANSQENASASTVTAKLTGTATLAVTESAGSATVTAPSLTVSGNRSEALATGVTAANALSVTATTVDLTAVAATGGAQSLDTALDTGSISASYAALNEQLVSAAVTASATPLAASAAFALTVGDNTYGATVINDANRLTAQAQAAVAANSIGLNIGTITLTAATEANNVAALLNVQEVAAAVTATAAPNGASAVVLTRLGDAAGDDLTNASVSTSTNRITAIANGAVASNSLSAAGTSLQVFDGSTGGDAGLATVTTAGLLSANAAFTIINRQEFSTTGPVEATLRQTAASAVTDSALVRTFVAGDVGSSNIASNGNMLTALASSLDADNSLMLAGTAVRTTGALVNSQGSSAAVNALIGYDGSASTAGTAPTIVTNSGSGTVPTANLTVSGSNHTSTTSVSFTVASLSAAEAAYLTGLGFTGATTGSTTIVLPAATTVSFASFNVFGSSASEGNTILTFAGFTIPGTSGSSGAPNAGGVIIAINENITSSSVSVASNIVTGQALGNTASNSLSVSATGLDADGASTSATAGLISAGINGADSDFALASDQSVAAGSASASTVFATFAIDQAPGVEPASFSIENATLAVDGNAQVAEAMANTVTNTLSVSATDMDVTAATSASLANRQGGTANVDASSDMEVFANVQSSASTISLDGNSNRATGVINNAANSLTVSGTNIAGTGALATVTIDTIDTNDTRASGSFALNNSQTASSTTVGGTTTVPDLDTTATTNIYNNDLVDTASTGIVNGSVSMANNLTFAESSANRATNSVTVAGGASNAAPAALANDQSSAATVTATATSTIGTTLFGTDATTDLAAASGSSVSVAGNTTQALARGNTATNTMVFTAGADFGTLAGANVNSGAGIATAAAAVLNRQENTAAVIASATATYNVVLNGGAGAATPGVTNGAVSVSGNTVAAAAFGNQATNRIELAVLNSGNATAAFNNRQLNSGLITATASSVTFASSVTGIVTNGAFRNVGNAASATAVGNSSITSIIGR